MFVKLAQVVFSLLFLVFSVFFARVRFRPLFLQLFALFAFVHLCVVVLRSPNPPDLPSKFHPQFQLLQPSMIL